MFKTETLLLKIFQLINEEYRAFAEKQKIGNVNVRTTAYHERFAKLVNQLKNTKDNIEVLVEKYMGELYKIHETTVGIFAKTYAKKDISVWRGSHDSLFAFLNVKRPSLYFLRLPTKLYNEFCKGITYFNGTEVTEAPYYYREDSCGLKIQNYLEKFKITASDKKKASKLKALKKCYIDRLIYDAIYNQILHMQDIQHLYELQNISRLFQDYFNESINVKLKYRNMIYPYEVEIINTKADGSTSIERYQKEEDIVNCTKIVIDNFPSKYIKRQSFEKEEEWEQV
jgi:hypothetical protein